MWIDEKYKSFGYSQLTEMLSLAPEHREKINSDMTIKQIREVKKDVVALSSAPVEQKVIDVDFKEVITEKQFSNSGIVINKDSFAILESQLHQARVENKNLSNEINTLNSKNDVKVNVNVPIEINSDLKDKVMTYLNNRKDVLKSIIKPIKKGSVDTNDNIEYRGALHEVLELIEILDDHFFKL